MQPPAELFRQSATQIPHAISAYRNVLKPYLSKPASPPIPPPACNYGNSIRHAQSPIYWGCVDVCRPLCTFRCCPGASLNSLCTLIRSHPPLAPLPAALWRNKQPELQVVRTANADAVIFRTRRQQQQQRQQHTTHPGFNYFDLLMLGGNVDYVCVDVVVAVCARILLPCERSQPGRYVFV